MTKQVNSAFHGEPDLAAWLRGQDLERIAICGITTNHCCETTARVGANVGFDVLFVLDATHTFDREGPDGTLMTADELARATADQPARRVRAPWWTTTDVVGPRWRPGARRPATDRSVLRSAGESCLRRRSDSR